MDDPDGFFSNEDPFAILSTPGDVLDEAMRVLNDEKCCY
jgi:hypothetical protein